LTQKAVRAFHFVVAAFPLVGAQMVIGNFFQSIGHAGKSIFLSVTRQMLFLIPLLALLPKWWGLDGVWLSMPISDSISFVAAACMLAYTIKRIKRLTPALTQGEGEKVRQFTPPLEGKGEAEVLS
jgi:Na+-driven multidrug efflux pump